MQAGACLNRKTNGITKTAKSRDFAQIRNEAFPTQEGKDDNQQKKYDNESESQQINTQQVE
jgi:hypothetical protein